jgi:hypothetical protein
MQNVKLPGFLVKTFSFNVGKLEISPTVWQAAAIVFLLFLLVLTLARLRHMYVNWSIKGFVPTLLIGFFLAIIFEALLVMGGKTLFIEILGWENAPKPIRTALESSRMQLVQVLDETDSFKDLKMSTNDVVGYYNKLNSDEKQSVHEQICKP